VPESTGVEQAKRPKMQKKTWYLAQCVSAASPYIEYGEAGEASVTPRLVFGVAASKVASHKFKVWAIGVSPYLVQAKPIMCLTSTRFVTRVVHSEMTSAPPGC
jgi:hypothetical protein